MRALVTGATAGIGRHIAAALAQAGADVVVTGRDSERGRVVGEEIGARFVPVDHASVAANVEFAESCPSLDILVNNVGGGVSADRTLTREGHERGLALNYLGPVALTRRVGLAEGAHVVNVVSSAYRMFTGDPFVEPDPYVGIIAHARAKQLHILATLALARRLGDRARVNAVNPGMAWTPGTQALTPAAVPAWRLIWPVVRFFQRRASAAKAASAPTRWALHPPDTGSYVESDGKPRPLPARLCDLTLQDRALDWVADIMG